MRTLALAVAIVIAVATLARANSELTMQDVQALDKQKHWTELLDSADRVKPAARSADWTKLVIGAATHVIDDIDRASTSGLREATQVIAIVPGAERRYSFLLGDAGYLDAKARALRGIVAACSAETQGGCGELVATLAEGVTRFPHGTAKAIALLVTDDLSPAEAMHFWALAVDDDAETCKHPVFSRSVIRTLRESAIARQVGDAQRAASTCYAALETALLDELVAIKDDAKPRPRFLDNACPVLKTHGSMTIAKRKKCP